MSDLTDTLQKLEALQAIYESKQAENESEDLVAAVDIGSTFTRCTFSFRNDDECLDLYVCNFGNFGNLLTGVKSNKAPTSVLLDDRGQFVSFGYEAQKDYAGFGKKKGFLLFEEFISQLHEEQNLNEATMLDSCDGKSRLSALHIISMMLKHLGNHISKEASLKTEGKAHSFACWVLAVPSVWDKPKRSFLRKAVLMAGLITDINSSRLRIITADEAAFQYCSGLDSDDFIAKPPRDKLSIEPGDKYIVVDAGGCTVSATAYEYRADGRSKAFYTTMSCGPVGTHVDQVFANIMVKIFSKEFTNQVKEESPEAWHHIMSTFIEKKHSVSSETPGSVKINIPSRFQDLFENERNTNIGEAIKKSKINGFKYIAPNMWVTTDTMRSLFKRIIEFTVTFIRNVVIKPKDIKRIYLVGGFFESDIVRCAIVAAFQDMNVLIPAQPSQVVSMSAVLLGLEPDA